MKRVKPAGCWPGEDAPAAGPIRQDANGVRSDTHDVVTHPRNLALKDV
jgi:hypothetical protein